MKILLAKPRLEPHTFNSWGLMACEPLELEILARAAQGHQVRIWDGAVERVPFTEVLREFDPDWLGLSGYLTQVSGILRLADLAKAYNPGIIVIIGGVQATISPADFTHPSVDWIAPGGLNTFIALLEGLGTNAPGLWYRQGEEWVQTPWPKTPPPDLLPDRTYFLQHQDQFHYLFYAPMAMVQTARGCPHHCKFCLCWRITRGEVYQRSLERVFAEIASLPVPYIFIVDDLFLGEEERLEAFLAGLEEREIKKEFIVYGRADFIATHPNLIGRFASLGLRAVIVGMEAVEDGELKRWDKGSQQWANTETSRILRRLGVDLYALFILDPDWDQAAFRRMKRVVAQMKIDFVTFSTLTPLPGTPLAREYESRRSQDLSRYDFLHLTFQPQAMRPLTYYIYLLGLHLRLGARPQALLRTVRRVGLRPVLRVGWQSTLSLGSFVYHLLIRR